MRTLDQRIHAAVQTVQKSRICAHIIEVARLNKSEVVDEHSDHTGYQAEWESRVGDISVRVRYHTFGMFSQNCTFWVIQDDPNAAKPVFHADRGVHGEVDLRVDSRRVIGDDDKVLVVHTYLPGPWLKEVDPKQVRARLKRQQEAKKKDALRRAQASDLPAREADEHIADSFGLKL